MNKVVKNESNNKINSTISLNVCGKIIDVRVTAIKLTYYNVANY